MYQAPEGEGDRAHSPPTQVVRQLVVTDNNKLPGGQPANQLQLPQRPTPPNILQQKTASKVNKLINLHWNSYLIVF